MVPGAERRLAEAQRAGFTRALVPASSCTPAPAGITVLGVRTLTEALAVAGSDEGGSATVPGTMPGWSTVTAPASR